MARNGEAGRSVFACGGSAAHESKVERPQATSRKHATVANTSSFMAGSSLPEAKPRLIGPFVILSGSLLDHRLHDTAGRRRELPTLPSCYLNSVRMPDPRSTPHLRSCASKGIAGSRLPSPAQSPEYFVPFPSWK